jgi:D-alanyl-D-alanine carboxypeptidase
MMSHEVSQPRRLLRVIVAVLALVVLVLPATGWTAPYAALVMDARTGKVLFSDNADTRLHPASLTKMMTLYLAFQAIERGEIGLDSMVTVSKKAAGEAPSRLGLKAGQKIKLRYLIRAAAVKSANDCATAIGEAISGSEEAFAKRMNRTAKQLGMKNSTFKNANGLTEQGHMSTARDMTVLGRHLFYDFPQYYNIFSRRSADAGIAEVANTNRRFLDAYEGADGIKTGYTVPAGFSLTASAERGKVRIIATVLGGTSTAQRNAKMAELLDLGFRKAPRNVQVRAPQAPDYIAPEAPAEAAEPLIADGTPEAKPSAKPKATGGLLASLRPKSKPAAGEPAATQAAPDTDLAASIQASVADALAEAGVVAPVETAAAAAEAPAEDTVLAAAAAPKPRAVVFADVAPEPEAVPTDPEVVTRISTSGGRHWGINVGRFNTRGAAERALLKTQLTESATLNDGLRKVVGRGGGYDANFMGLSQEQADLACRRLQARAVQCFTIGP